MKGCSIDPKAHLHGMNKARSWALQGGRLASLFVFYGFLLAVPHPLTSSTSDPSGPEPMLLEYLKNEEYGKAIAPEEQIIEDNPGSEMAAKAQFSIAGIYINFAHDYPKAYCAYKKVVEEYIDSPYIEDALYRMALLSLKLGEIEETAKHLDRLKNTGASLCAV